MNFLVFAKYLSSVKNKIFIQINILEWDVLIDDPNKARDCAGQWRSRRGDRIWPHDARRQRERRSQEGD